MNLHNRRGFTLVEVLVDLVILAVGLVAIAGMLLTSTKGNHQRRWFLLCVSVNAFENSPAEVVEK